MLTVGAQAGSASSSTASVPGEQNYTHAERRALPFTAVHLQDSFWTPKQTIYRQKTIPHSWQYVQKEIEDNEIAAGWKHIERGQDTPWNQANLHKVLETAAYALGQAPDPDLEKKVEYIISAIHGAQQPNGYVNALITVRHMKPWTNLDGQHEGYVAGHLIEAAVAYYLATGHRDFLEIASKMADHIYQHFITEGNEGVCGHAELELALVRLYQVTGEKRYLELAQNWIERRGHPWHYSTNTPREYFMDHLPIRQVPEVVGHAVRTLFYLTGVAEVASETGDPGLRAAAERLWHDATFHKMYVTGGMGSSSANEGFGPAYDLPNHGYSESCANCGVVYFSNAMFTLDGNSESVDILERALYNAVLHGMSLDGVTTYYQNFLSDANNARGNIWVCCPPCLSRTLLRVQDYLYARTDHDLYVNLYAGSTATAALAGGRVSIRQDTDYPWNGKVTLTLEPERKMPFGLRLRIPGWCRSYTLALNGKNIARPHLEKGYAVLSSQWQPGDTVTLDMAMPVERVAANPQVKEDRGQVALQRGPLIYAFEAVDNNGDTDVKLPAEPGFQVQWQPGLLGGVTTITGRRANGKPFTAIPYYALANREKSQQVVWVPQDGLPADASTANDSLYHFWSSPQISSTLLSH